MIRSNNGIVFSTELEGYITYCLRYFITKERITNVLSEVCDKLEMGLTPVPYWEDMGNPNAAPAIYSINIK